eukprot:6467910-Amphidinium_carterae.1
MTKANGFACHHYGMWALPMDWVRDLASIVMTFVDFDFIQQAVGLARRVSVRFTPAATPSRILKLWFNNFPSRRKSASAGVVTHTFVCCGQEVSKSFMLRDHLREDDVHWLSHVLAMCLASLLDCQIHHWGVKPKLSWESRDKSRSDFWASIRAQLPFGVRVVSSDVSRIALEHQYNTCVQQHALMENVLGEYPFATAETHSLKRHRYCSSFA